MQAFVGSVRNTGISFRYVSASSPKYSLLNVASAKTARELSDLARNIARGQPRPQEAKLLIHHVEYVDGIEADEASGDAVNKRVSVVDVDAWLQSIRVKKPEDLRGITEFSGRVVGAWFVFNESR